MLEENYNNTDHILNDDELESLITEKFQRLQEQIAVRKEVDNKISKMLDY